MRAQLYAIRALIAGDPVLIEALDKVAERRRQAEMRIDEGRELFGCFNRIPVEAASDRPWRKIEDLGSDFMGAAEDVQRAGVLSDRFPPRILKEGETGITALPPELIQTSAAGVRQVQSVLGPEYIQGPGGLLQVFQNLSENGLPDPSTP